MGLPVSMSKVKVGFLAIMIEAFYLLDLPLSCSSFCASVPFLVGDMVSLLTKLLLSIC
jgi:hypothetical protein